MILSRDQICYLVGFLLALALPLMVVYAWAGFLATIQGLAIEFCLVSMGGMLLGGSRWFQQQNNKLGVSKPQKMAHLN